MSPVEKNVVIRKMNVIIESLKTLMIIIDMNVDEYEKDVFKRKATERLLQELIEAAIDLNIHVITQTGHEVPDDYYDSFIRMGEIGVITPELATQLAPSAGLRNRLVHEYDVLNHSIILKSVLMAQDLYPLYVKEIEEKVDEL